VGSNHQATQSPDAKTIRKEIAADSDVELSKLLAQFDKFAEENPGKPVSALILELLPKLLELSPSPNRQKTDAVPLPKTAPALWKADKQKGDTPPEFIRRHYDPWIPGITRADIYRLDRPLYRALYSWLDRNKMPEDLDLPTRTLATTRWIERVESSESPATLFSSTDQLKQFRCRKTPRQEGSQRIT